ncbi:MAG: class I tRNA ligase family protein [archaeon]|mgnify:CR=1 FL=1
MVFEESPLDFASIEKKWQGNWEKDKIFEVSSSSTKPKYYVLEMFPYPSGAGLHMGHALNYTIGDIYARFKRMNGFNVLYPMGYDAFGLPAENAAIKAGEHPKSYTTKSITNFIRQQKSLGLSYDWSRLVKTCEPEYYKWNQFFFLKFYENGLVYRKKSAVNWCPKCNTVLANEQVHSGKCWRHSDTDVEMKQLEQWFIRTTKYSEELLEKGENLAWPERIKTLQKNWIGKSFGTEINFKINGTDWPIFTTRPDTIYGVTFLVISAQHPKLFEMVTPEQRFAVEEFLKKLKSVSEKELEDMGKEGVFTGAYAINPLTDELVPVWAGNFVVADYGAGMVMAVPAHDQRDFEFAVKYKIPLKQVIAPAFITDSGPDAIRKDMPVVERKAVFAIVKHWNEDKYYCLDWTKFNWKTFILGGVEENETPEMAAVRETREESGYQDIKSVKRIGFEVFSKFFATHKNVNRAAYQKTFLVELASDEFVEPLPEHVKNHKGLWVAKKDVANFLNIESNSAVWKDYLKGGEAFTEEGLLINSGAFSGMESAKAIDAISGHIAKYKFGQKTVNYKFRDWLVSRQRYWGTPIPMIYCDKCGLVPVPLDQLPVVLPDDVKFGEGNPLASNKEFVSAKCPTCGAPARRETDTMDTFFDSSWYYLRYCDSINQSKPYDGKKLKYWMPVDQYIGGAEHACMHLIYARFFTKALRDMNMLDFDEPFTKLFNQGMLHGPDGNKMSKSLGNTVDPIENVNKFSADSLRFNLMSLSAPNSDSVWSDRGMESAHKQIVKYMNFFGAVKFKKSSKMIESKVNKTIKLVTEDIANFKYNIAIIKLRELFDAISSEGEIAGQDAISFIKLLHPICPHITEELWHNMGNKGYLSLETWPIADESKIDEQLERIESAVTTMRLDVLRIKDLAKIQKVTKVKVFVAPEWKWKALKVVAQACQSKPDFGAAMKALMADSSLKQYGSEMQSFAKTAVLKLAEISELKQYDEIAVLNEAKPALEKEFGSVEIISADTSKEVKAKNAFPAKPALIIE